MAKGKKLDLDLGAKFGSDWAEVSDVDKKIKTEIQTPQKHQLHFSKEKRRGKVVTLVGPFALSDQDAKTLLKKLKKSLGTGGSYKEAFMEFQGELKEKLKELLLKEAFRFKAGH